MKHCGLVCGTTELFQLFPFFTEKYPNHRTYEEDHEGLIKAQLALTKWNVIFLSHLSFFRKTSPTHSCTKPNITAALWCCSSSVRCLMTGSSVSYSAIMWRVVSSPCDSFTGTLPVCEVLHWVQLSEGLIGHSWHLRLGPISRKGSCHRVRSLKCLPWKLSTQLAHIQTFPPHLSSHNLNHCVTQCTSQSLQTQLCGKWLVACKTWMWHH